MPLSKLSSKSQIVIPAAIRKRLNIQPGDELEIKFNIVALFPVKAKGGTSTAYSYYKPEVKAEARGQNFDVEGEVQSRFGPTDEEGEEGEDDEEDEDPEPAPPQLPFALVAVLVVGLILAAAGRVRERN